MREISILILSIALAGAALMAGYSMILEVRRREDDGLCLHFEPGKCAVDRPCRSRREGMHHGCACAWKCWDGACDGACKEAKCS